MSDTKLCIDCQTVKPRSDFHRQTASKDGLHYYCRACNYRRTRIWQLANPEKKKKQNQNSRMRTRNGMQPAEYLDLLEQQGGGCGICSTKDRYGHTASRTRFDIDHDHVTGKIRGLLCQACNMGIGQLGDDPARLRAAADYIERSRP